MFKRAFSIMLLLPLFGAGNGKQYTVPQWGQNPHALATITFTRNCYIPGNTSPYTTTGKDSSGAKLIIFEFSFSPPVSPIYTVTDSVGGNNNGTATSLTAYGSAAASISNLQYYAAPTYTGTGHTFTFTKSGSPNFLQVCVTFVYGVNGTYDAGTDHGYYVGTGTTCQPSATTNPGTGQHFVDFIASSAASGTQTVNSPFTLDKSLPLVGGTAYALGVAHDIETGATGLQPTMSGLAPGVSCAIASWN